MLWLCLLVPLCTLRAPSPSSWGPGRWEYPTHQRIHIRGNGWEHPRTQERCQGAGDAQVSAGGLLVVPLLLKDASSDTRRGWTRPGWPRSVPACCPIRGQASRNPRPAWVRSIRLYWHSTGRVLLNGAWPNGLCGGDDAPGHRGADIAVPMHSAGRAAPASGARTRLNTVCTLLTKPPGAQAAGEPAVKRQKHLLEGAARWEQLRQLSGHRGTAAARSAVRHRRHFAF